MSIVQIDSGAHVTVCNDSRGLTQFAGIGSELYVAVEMGRRAIGVELKTSYFQQAVRNMNAMTSQGSLFEAAA